MNQNIYSLNNDLVDRAWDELYATYLTEGLDTLSDYVHPLNYCGYVVRLPYFIERGCGEIEKLYNSIPWLKPRIIFYETDPNLRISDAVGDDKDYGAEFLDHYSIHMHRVEGAMAMNNTNATINFPLLNCDEGSTTTWYKLKDGQVIDTGYLSRTDKADVIQQAHLKDRECNLMRMDRWHSVHNNTGERRVIANWDFHHFVPWDDAIEILIH